MLYERFKFGWKTAAVLLPMMMGGLVIGASLPADAAVRHDGAAVKDDMLVPEGGRLDAFDDEGQPVGPCPLKHTDVDVQISGHFSRVNVAQRYHNPYDQKIEAVYTFPLSHRGAVDRMTMTVGDRVIKGEVKERQLARNIYETARQQGHVSSLLEQQRPNIFTQSVANIEPGAEVLIEISYVEVLESVDGRYQFDFPMVVAPRYTPGTPLSSGHRSRGPGHPFAGGTGQVPDASRVTPMPGKPDQRAGHDIAITVTIDTGGPGIVELKSASHDIDWTVESSTRDDELPHRATVFLKSGRTIPNQDFRLAWRLNAQEIEEAILTHTGVYGDLESGFFTLILQSPERVSDDLARPRELIFVLDNSGSMRGRNARLADRSALDAAKDVITQAIDTMRPKDRFNVISFNHTLDVLWSQPHPNTPENRTRARQYVDQRQGGGGTEMRNAMLKALNVGPPGDRPNRADRSFDYDDRVDPDLFSDLDHDDASDQVEPLRIVLFVTDGLVSNDAAIIEAIRQQAHQTRVFTIGMSSAPNRHLLDEMARTGRGAADYVLPHEDVAPIVQRFAERVASPVLTDIELSFDGDIQISELLPSPAHLPDLFDVQPLVIHGRYTGAGQGALTIRGRTGEGRYERKIDLEFPDAEPQHDMIATLWAREKVGELMREGGAERMSDQDKINAIVALGENFQIVTHHTSFVAVELQRVTIHGQSMLVPVPIEFPEGMSWEGVFGGDASGDPDARQTANAQSGHSAAERPEANRGDRSQPPAPRNPRGFATGPSSGGHNLAPSSGGGAPSGGGSPGGGGAPGGGGGSVEWLFLAAAGLLGAGRLRRQLRRNSVDTGPDASGSANAGRPNRGT